MPTIRDLCTWLRHNVEDLRLAPDMVTEAAGPVVRFRWHDIVDFGGAALGLGIDLHPGPCLGEIWLYGHGARQIRLCPKSVDGLPPSVRARLRCILLAHVDDREHDWGRGRGLFDQPAKSSCRDRQVVKANARNGWSVGVWAGAHRLSGPALPEETNAPTYDQ
ncbi:MAG: hypothetical protein KDK70_13140 [Myxococcales bacterium]|nr:hypothetical protein [Myxococcales bacterium]